MIRVAVLDDHPVVRAGVRHFLSADPDLSLVAEAGSGAELLMCLRTCEVDVLVLNISMPGQNGVEVLAALRARAPDVRVLVLSGFPEQDYATTMLRQGASGYVHKSCGGEELLSAIHTVARGRRYISARVAECMADAWSDRASGASHEQLSERELQVFLRLARGETIGQLADQLALSVKTVSTYRTRIMSKMALASNSDLTYYALKHGLIR